MAGRIRDEDIAVVRDRSPIDEVIGEYLQLRSAGGDSLKGLCPFHDEKTPSFNVTPARGLYYCLAGETRVLTMDGVRPIRELAGSTHRVLGKNANWIEAPFYSFGVQPLMRLTLSRYGVVKYIYATPEHRWFVRSGRTRTSEREVVTKDLRPGHRLASKFPGTRVRNTTPAPFGVAHGLTFGDGTRIGKGSMAQLDAVKDVLLDKHRFRFNSAPVTFERRGWVVKEVAETDRVEEVFCAVVDAGHAFTLEDNILTGNCFSCGEGGDVIKFVQKIDGLTFIEAVERLAGRAGIDLRYEQGGYVPGQEQSRRRRLVDAHRAAAEFYQEQLQAPGGVTGRAFLTERGFERADAERFGVGYAPAGWEELTRHLRARGFPDAELIAGGLALEGRRGPRDRFRNRLMWPIRDLSGDVIAFGARKLDPDDEGPKYLNTPETPLFRKSTVLYGADLAKREISHRRQAVIVEGYTDVMACHLADVPTAVATCGTSFGDEHIKVLRRLVMDTDGAAGEVIFTFDGDAAGQKAALRAFGMEERFVTQTFVTVQPDGLDPCDLRLAHGDAAVRDLIARRIPLFEFAIRSVVAKHDLDTTEGQIAALDEAAPIVARIKDSGLRARYAVNLDRWLGLMDERFVLARVRAHAGDPPGGPGGDSGRGGARPGRRDAARPGAAGRGPVGAAGAHGSYGAYGGPGAAGPGGNGAAGYEGQGNGRRPPSGAPGAQEEVGYDSSDPVVQVEREALKLAVQRPGLCGPEFDALGDGAFTVPAHAAVFRLIAESGGTSVAGGGREWAARLRDDAPNDRARAFITRLAVEPPQLTGEPDARYVDVVLARVGELAVSREIASVKSKLQRMNPVQQQVPYNQLFGDLVGLEQRRKALLDRAAGA